MLKIEVKCPHCPERISRITWALTRLDFSRKYGEEIEETCAVCRKRSSHSYSSYRAHIPASWQLIAGAGTLALILGVWWLLLAETGLFVLSAMILAPVFLMQRSWRDRQNTFNRS